MSVNVRTDALASVSCRTVSQFLSVTANQTCSENRKERSVHTARARTLLQEWANDTPRQHIVSKLKMNVSRSIRYWSVTTRLWVPCHFATSRMALGSRRDAPRIPICCCDSPSCCLSTSQRVLRELAQEVSSSAECLRTRPGYHLPTQCLPSRGSRGRERFS